MTLRATGILRHIFHGTDETARIVLQFTSIENAKAAKQILPCKWKQVENGCVVSVNSKELQELKEFLKSRCNLTILPCARKGCKDQCRNAPIDTLAHSVDVGAMFTVDIPSSVPNEQEKLF